MARLVISRRKGESFKIGDNVTVTLLDFHGNQARIVIEAPTDVRIDRQEIWERKKTDAPRQS